MRSASDTNGVDREIVVESNGIELEAEWTRVKSPWAKAFLWIASHTRHQALMLAYLAILSVLYLGKVADSDAIIQVVAIILISGSAVAVEWKPGKIHESTEDRTKRASSPHHASKDEGTAR